MLDNCKLKPLITCVFATKIQKSLSDKVTKSMLLACLVMQCSPTKIYVYYIWRGILVLIRLQV